MIWVLIGVFLVGFIYFAFFEKFEDSGPAVLSLVLAVVFFLIYMITFSVSVSNNAELRAFAEQNRQVYAEVAELTRVMVAGNQSSQSVGLVDGKSWEQVKIAGDRLKELRDSIAQYNRELRSKREYASHWYLRMWIAEPPAELEYMDFSGLVNDKK